MTLNAKDLPKEYCATESGIQDTDEGLQRTYCCNEDTIGGTVILPTEGRISTSVTYLQRTCCRNKDTVRGTVIGQDTDKEKDKYNFTVEKVVQLSAKASAKAAKLYPNGCPPI